MADGISSELCQQCAECCRKFPFVKLSKDDISALESVTKLHFTVFTNPMRKEEEEYFLQFNENGHCVFLREQDGTYACSVYEARPVICRDFPLKDGHCSRC